MIGDCKRPARTGVEQLTPELFANANEPALAKHPIEVDRHRHVAKPVLREHDHLRASALVEANEIGAEVIHLLHVGQGFGGAGPTRCRL